MKHYGIEGVELSWFESYLSNRKQYTVYQNCKSSLKSVNFGVPQGSILGPLLFLVFINDLPLSVNNVEFILYADDTTVFITGGSIIELEQRANAALAGINFWMIANRLTLNSKKTQSVLFHRKQRIVNPLDLSIYLDESCVGVSDSVKFLGVVLDKNLSWDTQTSNVLRRLSKYVPIMHRIRDFCDVQTLKIVYNSLVYPNLIYGNSVWGFCTKKVLNPLNITNKKIIRAMLGLRFRDHTAGVFNDLKILNLQHINFYMVCLFVYKCLHSNNFSTWFKFSDILYNTRASNDPKLFIPRILNKHAEQTIKYRGPLIFNQFCSIENLFLEYNSFKRFVKNKLLYIQFV